VRRTYNPAKPRTRLARRSRNRAPGDSDKK
jgi:hypothetical protein